MILLYVEVYKKLFSNPHSEDFNFIDTTEIREFVTFPLHSILAVQWWKVSLGHIS